jgi:DNA-binding IclR family transcriptional regulator
VTGEIAVGVGAVDVIRRVGPTAWSVLTALALDADAVAGRVVVRASVRSLAAALRLDKDTVARALSRLRDEGLVVLEPGRFTPGVYWLTVPAELIRYTVAASAPRSGRRHAADDSGFQLALLEAD